jgi:hypothetical protein
LTGLSANTTYYARAYATNAAGTCYGAVIQFTTSPGCPNVTTAPVLPVNSITANLGGTVTSSGGATVTARGVIVTRQNSTFTYPNGTGLGTFYQNISLPFQSGVTYSVRAYASNSIGTCYGSTITFVW